jgi:hypothetical protein
VLWRRSGVRIWPQSGHIYESDEALVASTLSGEK